MALQRQKISIPFQLGIETKLDDKQKPLGYLEKLENAVFDTIKELRKRNGYDKILLKTLTNTNIENSLALTTFKNELNLLTNDKFYSYSKSIDKWIEKGKIFTAFPTSTPVIRNDYDKSNLDAVSSESLDAFVYQDSRGVLLTIKDNSSGNFLVSDTIISATGVKPSITNIQNTLFIFYIIGNEIRYKNINLISPTTISSEATATVDLHPSDQIYDVIEAGNKNILGYNNTSGDLSIRSIDTNGDLSSITSISGENASKCLEIYEDPSSRIVLTYSNGTEVKSTVRALTLTGQITAPVVIESISGVVNCTAIQCSSTEYTVIYEIEAVLTIDYYIKQNMFNQAGVVQTPSILISSVGLASRAFCHDSRTYVNTIHSSELQSTYFIVETDGKIVSKISPLSGGNLVTKGALPKVTELSTGEFLLVTQIRGRTVTDDGTFYSLLGINSTILDFEISDPYQNASLGPNLHITGGTLKLYDGNTVTEHGFQVFPEDIADIASASTGGAMEDGIYQYSAVYAWTDNFGQIHRSAPSIPISVTLAAATATQTVDIQIPTLRLTDKENAIVELYRTEALGDIFYKVTSSTAPIFNSKSVNSVTIQDTISDTDLIDNEILYTTGGFLENIVAPSSRIIEAFGDRIFLAGLEDTNKIVFSKVRDENEVAEFNDTFYKYVPSIGGNITAMQVMDDKLIIFKQDAIFYISGSGPNDLGEQDTFIEPQQISNDIGAIDGKSVVLTPLGTMFKSRKGIYLLGRGLDLQYIGANVEDFNDLTISSAEVIPNDNQVRFLTSDGNCLVYNYFANQWATFANHRGISAVTLNSDYYYLRPDGIVYKENKEKFSDQGSSIPMALETSWISFADVQGFQRVYKLLLLGEFKSKHKLRIRIAYNFIDAFVHEKVIDTADFTDDSRYGDDSPYGDPTTKAYGGDGNLHQLRLDLKRQKCQSVKIRIEEIQDQTIGEGLSLSNVLFEVGIKSNGVKVDQSKTYGSK